MAKTAIGMAMGQIGTKLLIQWILILSTAMACSSKPCHEVDMTGIPESVQNPKAEKNILVFKYDGTKQCAMGQEISLDAMSKQLRDIKIFSMNKKHDGMMRIQVCGAPTGHANVYEISEKNLDKAKKNGFQPWTFK